MTNPNIIRIEGDIAYVELTDRRGNFVAEAIIDAVDVSLISEHRCYASGRHLRPAIWKDGKQVYLYRFLLNASPDVFVDHRNHKPLDCRRSNLRSCTQSQNLQNRAGPTRNSSSGIRNVWWNKQFAKWEVRVKLKGISHFFGYFDDITEAETAAQTARAQLHGAFAS